MLLHAMSIIVWCRRKVSEYHLGMEPWTAAEQIVESENTSRIFNFKDLDKSINIAISPFD